MTFDLTIVLSNKISYYVIFIGNSILLSSEGGGQIWFDDVQCSGSENRLVDCSTSAYVNCPSNRVAGVRCQGTASTCDDGDIRLYGGHYQGRVDVCYNNHWGTVCSHHWDTTDAVVACRQLGLPTAGESTSCG